MGGVGVGNLDHEPAVPIPFTGIRFVLRSRLLSIPFEIRKESSGPLGIIRWSSFARYRDRGDCSGCHTEDRGVGAVEVFEETFRALRNRLLARLLRCPSELSKDSRRHRLGGAREKALCRYGGDCGGRIGDRDCIGPVEGTEKSQGDLRDCLVGLRLRSCRA